jgi:hypothetical protein
VKHSFTIIKRIPASRSNVIANYLDLEHLPVHSGLVECRVMSETERAACFEMTTKVGPFRFQNVHYFEFRPPHQVFHAIKSPLGPMYIVSTVEELDSGTPLVRSEVTVETTLDLPRWAYPLRLPLEKLLRRLNEKVLREDRTILDRRQALLGDSVEDYLRDQQRILFKDVFRRHYGANRGDERGVGQIS